MKKFLATFVLLLTSSTVFASHPHQATCIANGTYPDGSSASFLVQMSSERTYQNGDPNKDVHEYKFQARICDDDNDSGQCSTYESKSVTTSPTQTVTLKGMKNSSKTLFEGTILGDSMKGKLVQTISKNGQWVREMMPFETKLNCILQTWVELKAEDDSSSY
jgi:hypothetical protein